MASVFPDLKEKGICVGYDGRHNSKAFAHRTTATFLEAGVPVYLFQHLVPTPFVVCVTVSSLFLVM